MRRIQFILPGLFVTALLLVLTFASAAQAQTNRITFGMNPTIFRAGQPASAELSVSSTSITPLTLNPGSDLSHRENLITLVLSGASCRPNSSSLSSSTL